MKFSEYITSTSLREGRVDEGILDFVKSKVRRWIGLDKPSSSLRKDLKSEIHKAILAFTSANVVTILEYLFEYNIWICDQVDKIKKVAAKHDVDFSGSQIGFDIKVPEPVQDAIEKFSKNVGMQGLLDLEKNIDLSHLSMEELKEIQTFHRPGAVKYTAHFKLVKYDADVSELQKIAKEIDNVIPNMIKGGLYFNQLRVAKGTEISDSNRVTHVSTNYTTGIQTILFSITVG